MSRIGKLPIPIPAKVKVAVDHSTVKVEGPKGKLEKRFNPAHVNIAVADGQVTVDPAHDTRLCNAMHGTARSIIAGMVHGVDQGYQRKLEIQGVGFKAAVNGRNVTLNLGYSHDIKLALPTGVDVTVDNGTQVTVSGYDKQAVGQVAATIYQHYPVEPYKGKGVRIVGRHVRRKEGKKAG